MNGYRQRSDAVGERIFWMRVEMALTHIAQAQSVPDGVPVDDEEKRN